jgi:hypothetical protein
VVEVHEARLTCPAGRWIGTTPGGSTLSELPRTRRHRFLRAYGDEVNRLLLERWLPKSADRVLKTDLFEEAVGDGLARLWASASSASMRSTCRGPWSTKQQAAIRSSTSCVATCASSPTWTARSTAWCRHRRSTTSTPLPTSKRRCDLELSLLEDADFERAAVQAVAALRSALRGCEIRPVHRQDIALATGGKHRLVVPLRSAE